MAEEHPTGTLLVVSTDPDVEEEVQVIPLVADVDHAGALLGHGELEAELLRDFLRRVGVLDVAELREQERAHQLVETRHFLRVEPERETLSDLMLEVRETMLSIASRT